MHRNHAHKKRVQIARIFLATFTVFSALFGHYVFVYAMSLPVAKGHVGAPVLPSHVEPAAGRQVGIPVRLKIPRIRVNAAIREVGLAPDGSMGVPKVPRDAAWYKLGPKPGEPGNAVINGHVNWLYGATGVFEQLKSVKPGDTVTVQDDTGTDITFIVRETRIYDAAADATDILVSTDGKAHLNLITCSGVWDKKLKQYSKRLVVFADLEDKAVGERP